MTAAKAWIALFLTMTLGGITTGISAGVIPNKYQGLALGASVVLTGAGAAIGVYKTPNAPTDLPPPKHLNRTGRSYVTDPEYVDD